MPEWYFRRGAMKAATDDRMEAASSSCTRWGIGFAGLVIAGVVAEFVIAGVHPPYDSFLEQWGSAVADALVAIGVAGEVAFGMWDGHIQTEIRRRSNDRLKEALTRAAAAEEALIEYRRTRRELLKSDPTNVVRLVEAIKPFAGTRFDIGQAGGNVREQWDFLWDIEPLFNEAGWIFVDWTGPQFIGRLNWTMTQHAYGITNVLNVSIESYPQVRDALLPAAEALADALNRIGIAAIVEPAVISSTSANADVLHFLVGEKR